MQDLFPAETCLDELFVSPANMEILGFSDRNNIQVLYTSTIDNLFVIPDCQQIKYSTNANGLHMIKGKNDENLRVIRLNSMFGRGCLSLEYVKSRQSQSKQGTIISTFERRGSDLSRLLRHIHGPPHISNNNPLNSDDLFSSEVDLTQIPQLEQLKYLSQNNS